MSVQRLIAGPIAVAVAGSLQRLTDQGFTAEQLAVYPRPAHLRSRPHAEAGGRAGPRHHGAGGGRHDEP